MQKEQCRFRTDTFSGNISMELTGETINRK